MDNAIKEKLETALGLVGKVKTDVELLHSKVEALGDAPTPEQIAELNSLSTQLVESLQTVDDQTPEETPETPVE